MSSFALALLCIGTIVTCFGLIAMTVDESDL